MACYDVPEVMAESSSLCRWLLEIVGDDLPSLLSFRSTGGATWAVTGCLGWFSKAFFLQSMIRTINPDMMEHRPGIIFKSAVCPLGDPDRCGASHVLLGGTDRVDPDRGARHVPSGGSLQCPPFNLVILLRQNGRVKKWWFWNFCCFFAFIVPRGGAEVKRRNVIYGEPLSLGIPRRHVFSITARLGVWNTEGLSPFK